MTKLRTILIATMAATSGLITGPSATRAEGLQPLTDAFKAAKPIIDMRLRYEFVDQDPLANNANAATLRTRGGFETGKAWNTSLLAEGEWVLPITSGYNSSINGKTTYPTVPDPKAFEVNRLQLTNTSLPATTVVVGRQRINIDDQRFIGNAGWRQNEQTFDAVRLTNKSVANLTLDAAYVGQVNRVFGNNSPVGRFDGDSYLANAGYQLPLGKLTAFAYLLAFEEAAGRGDSSQTYGIRFAGDKTLSDVKLVYAASYATQSDYATNLLNYSDDYYLAEFTGTIQKFSAGAGYEVLGGDGIKGFTAPLATLHKFQGWADKFLTTPANGVADLYFTGVYATKAVGPFETMSATVAYHRFDSDRLALHYGNEFDVFLQAKVKKFNLGLKYAVYNADRFATDTEKVWLQIEFLL